MQTRVQLNRVVLHHADGAADVCSLVLADNGLYVIRTGSIGALPSSEGTDFVNQVEAVGSSQEFIEELAKNEDRLRRTSAAEMVKTPGSAFIPLDQITMVQHTGGDDDRNQALTIVTRRGNFKFGFPQARREDVKNLKDMLTRR